MGTKSEKACMRRAGTGVTKAAAGSAVLMLLAACGGGGGDGGGPSGPLTRTEANAGDYFIFSNTTTTTVPSGTPVGAYNSIVTYRSVAPDGTNQRVTTASAMGPVAQQSTYNVNVALVTVDGNIGSTVPLCTYSAPQPVAPPYPRSVGQTFGNTVVRTCNGTAVTIATTGSVTARENLVLPIGTFDSWRTQRTVTSTFATYVVADQFTCWYSVARGNLLRCDSNHTRTQNGAATPDQVWSVAQVATGIGGPGRASEGAVLPRFQGAWRVQYTGTANGTCAPLNVSAGGVVSGSCNPSTGGSFAVTGTVNASGGVSLTWAGGGALSGTLGTPYSGNGTWSQGPDSGTWTAVHY
jgi:hypothetical protein